MKPLKVIILSGSKNCMVTYEDGSSKVMPVLDGIFAVTGIKLLDLVKADELKIN